MDYSVFKHNGEVEVIPEWMLKSFRTGRTPDDDPVHRHILVHQIAQHGSMGSPTVATIGDDDGETITLPTAEQELWAATKAHTAGMVGKEVFCEYMDSDGKIWKAYATLGSSTKVAVQMINTETTNPVDDCWRIRGVRYGNITSGGIVFEPCPAGAQIRVGSESSGSISDIYEVLAEGQYASLWMDRWVPAGDDENVNFVIPWIKCWRVGATNDQIFLRVYFTPYGQTEEISVPYLMTLEPTEHHIARIRLQPNTRLKFDVESADASNRSIYLKLYQQEGGITYPA